MQPQPIDESTPKDRRLLLYVPDHDWVCGHWCDDRHAKVSRPYWTIDAEYAVGNRYVRSHQPTHWVELPEMLR